MARFVDRPAGTFGTGPPPAGVLGTGDVVTFPTGERLIVIAVCSVSYALRSLSGSGNVLVTPEELAEMLEGVDAASVVS